MRCKGTICRWKDDRGFGFIRPDEGGEEVFVHIKAFGERCRRPTDNDAVSYRLEPDARGRPRAAAVAYADGQLPPRVATPAVHGARGGSSLQRDRLWIVVVLLFLLGVWVAAEQGKLPAVVPAVYLGASVVAFLVYAWDKFAAQNGRWRTQESTLHLCALAGGWPGALAAQRLLRHKTRKTSFLLVFWLTVVANCVALGWLLVTGGAGLRG